MAQTQTQKPYVYLIGAGPGDPDLITVKGRACIASADVILYDYLANEELLSWAKPEAELIYSGKVGGQHNREQRQINDLMVAKALEGNVVARLKGGDPFIFGRGGEECQSLREAGIPFEVVPGITAAMGASAYAGIPLTHRNVTTSVAFVTGHESDGKLVSEIDWEGLSLGSGTVVFYMGMKNLHVIAENMVAHGRPSETPVALVRWGTRPEQEVLTGTLANIAAKAKKVGFKAPAVTIVGEVVRLRDELRWFDNRPLSGRRIIVTRAADQAGEFSRLLRQAGAHVLECPTIAIAPAASWDALDAALAELPSCDWTIFSSYNAVKYLFDRLLETGRDARAFGNCRICAVGPKTAEALAGHGIRADLVPEEYKAEGVVREFGKLEIAGKEILYPRGDRARDVIPTELSKMGATVIAPVAYRNITPDEIPAGIITALEEKSVDCITFTSSSTVSNLAKIVGENRLLHLLEGVAVAAIGPITGKTCFELGLAVSIQPEHYTLEAMVTELSRHFSQKA